METYVSIVDEIQLNTHAGNIGSTHVRPVHQTNAVHCSYGNNQAAVNAADDAALLSLGEAKVVVFEGRDIVLVALGVFHRAVDVAVLKVLLFGLGVGSFFTHDGQITAKFLKRS